MGFRQFIKRTALAGSIFAMPLSASFVQAQEWEESSPYYEDDAWWDITEWFDGNDYNSTSETAWDTDNDDVSDYDYDYYGYDDSDGYLDYSSYDNYRYDYGYDYGFGSDYDYDYDYDYDSGLDESYDSLTGSYGYDNLYNDDWFYDWYDDGYGYYSDLDSDGLYDYSYRYYDWDNDGYYDAYSTYTDWDGDGVFDDWDYYSLNDVGSSSDKRDQARQQASSQSESQSISGEITKSKRVSVKDTRNQVVQIDRDNGESVFVDLGPASQLNDFDLGKGDQITVRGPMTKVGDKEVLIAKNLKSGNNSASIDRNRRQFKGTIDGMRTAEGRGQQHQIVVLRNNNGKNRMVDLGASDRLDIDLSQGDTITVRGALVKINDREVILAQSMTHDGEQVSIDRRQSQSN